MFLVQLSSNIKAFQIFRGAFVKADYLNMYTVSISTKIAVRDMVNMKKFEGREDFAVVVQPFLEETVLPVLPVIQPSCFHFYTHKNVC